jgi:hypothetical protein
MPRAGAARFALPVLLLSALPAHAQDWHEAYRDGVAALARGQAARAVELLERAAALRPEPGRNVVTYGTNVEARYYPYLRLAEAHLLQRNLEGARAALKRSEAWGREPADQRAQLAARVEAAAPRPPAPPPTAPAVAPSTVAPPPPAEPPPTTAAAPPSPVDPPTAAPSVAPSTAPRATPRAPAPSAAATPAPPAAPREVAAGTRGSLEVVSQPPGAAVYLDDELVGTTDPEWGRLVKSDVPAGRHRVRLSLAGHEDVAEDVDVAAGGATAFRRRLNPAGGRIDGRLVFFAALAVVLLGLTVWALRRPATPPAEPTPRHPSAHTPGTPARVTPGGGPGVVRDAEGVERFGDYRLLEPLGRGGMASVYKAERGGEVCALKRPLPAFLEEEEFLQRFLREAELGRALNHPNIVRILERGAVGTVPYFTMELIAGETLQERLRRAGPFEPRAAARIVVQVAEALDYAHLKGVVHRDLKPSNIALLEDGEVRVMDFGIAQARRFEGLTVTGAFLGSPEYVAPETIDGRGTDARSDLYSLGVVFYETLTGRRPFTADTPFAILQKHLNEVPVRPSVLRPDVPPDLERIVLRLLSKEPEGRHGEAEDLVVELREFLNRAA